MPHATIESLSGEVAADSEPWVISATAQNVKSLAEELWEKERTYERLKDTAVNDLLIVLRFSIA
jgi:hypothetical protein